MVFALLCFISTATAQEPRAQRDADPTRPQGRLAETLRGRVANLGKLRIRALVVGADNKGVALVGSDDFIGSPLREGSTFHQDVDGVTVPLKVVSVSDEGVQLASEKEQSRFIRGCSRPLQGEKKVATGELRYVESTRVPLETLLRLIADQTGINIAVSAETAATPVSIFLRNVPADVAVEEICRATGLWFRRDAESKIVRVTTMREYEQSLASFREERTESFTLLYPNVAEVASVIYGLYPERVLLSLGEDDILDDEKNDISRRFDRFNTIAESGNSSFLEMDVPEASTTSSSSGSGVLYGGGNVTVIGRKGRERAKESLSTSDAEAVSRAEKSGNTNAVMQLLGDYNGRAASIFVTVSRRNNMIVVRTSDTQAMDDIRALVKRLDVPTPMVLLEVKVLELSIDDGFNSSFEYSFQRSFNTTGDDPSPVDVSGGFPGFDPLSKEARTDSMSFQVLSKHLQARIQLLEKDGKVKTLATPTLLTANNEVSRLFIGSERPIVKNITSQTIVNEQTTVTVPQTEIDFQSVGTMLLITPNINADRTVTLRLLQENSEIEPAGATIPVYSQNDGGLVQNVPVDVVSSRSITGTFVAKDENTIAVGGLISETEKEVVSRVPVLGRIPLLGFLFRSTEKVKSRSELIVMIKPHVISTPSDGEAISRRVLDGLSAHPARDGRSSLLIHKDDAKEAKQK